MNTVLADHLEVWGFESDYIIFSDGSLGFGFEVEPIDVACWDTEQVNGLAQRISQFLNGLPSGVDVQFIQEIERGNEALISAHADLGTTDQSNAARSLCAARVERLREYDKEGRVPKHTLKLFLRRPFSDRLIEKPRLLSKPKRFEQIGEERLSREVQLASRFRDDISQNLSSLGLRIWALSSEQVAQAMYAQWNPTRPVKLAGFDPEDVRSSILFTDVAIQERGFVLGDMNHRVVSLKLLPDQTFASMAAVLRELPFDSKLFLSIHVPDQTKELETLQTQRRVAYSMARGKRAGVTDLESEAKFQDLETLLEQMIAQGEKVFRVSLNVLLRSKSEDQLESQVSQTLMAIREMAGAEGMEESLASFPIFSEFSIPNARAKERAKRVKTSNLCDLLPIYGPWRGFQKPSILLRTRMGSLLAFDPFSSDLTNSNQLISGGSGSGKSFLTNILLLQMLKENPKVYFVDIGGSYRKLCENLGGQYLPLGVSSGISLNPFDLGPGETAPSSQKIKFLLGLIELMTKEEDEPRLPKLHRAEIEETIGRVYERERRPRLSHLRDLLLQHPDVEIKRYGRILTPWCGETPFGQFVDRDTSISLENQLVAFDLKGLESYPDLQAVCLFLITDLVWREVQRDRERMKFLVFDECWKLLKNESGMVFIEEVFRTFRKYFASAIAISQDIDDFAKSKIAGAILPNCSIKWVLMQQQSDPVRIKEALDLNDNELNLIKSLYQDKGRFSEAFLIAQKNRVVAVIESTPLEYWIATTDPKDLAAMEAYAKTNPGSSHIEVLDSLAKAYPRGVAAYEVSASSRKQEGV